MQITCEEYFRGKDVPTKLQKIIKKYDFMEDLWENNKRNLVLLEYVSNKTYIQGDIYSGFLVEEELRGTCLALSLFSISGVLLCLATSGVPNPLWLWWGILCPSILLGAVPALFVIHDLYVYCYGYKDYLQGWAKGIKPDFERHSVLSNRK